MIHFNKKAISFLLIFFLFVGIVGAVNVDTTYAATKKIHLKKTTVSVAEGKTYQQKLIDKNGKTIKATKVKWKSSNTSVAKINKKGKVTAVKSGTAKMTANYKGKKYKFTVKVTVPFESGEKPEVFYTQLVTDEKDNIPNIFVAGKGLKDAISCECYVSVNGAPYVLFDTDECSGDICFFIYENPKDGFTYSFKIRGINGQYYSEYSDEMSYSMFNTSIVADPSSLTLKVGETKTINVTPEKSWYTIVADRNNTNVSFEFGEWIPGTDTVTLNITGERVGTSKITIFDQLVNSVTTEIDITVTE